MRKRNNPANVGVVIHSADEQKSASRGTVKGIAFEIRDIDAIFNNCNVRVRRSDRKQIAPFPVAAYQMSKSGMEEHAFEAGKTVRRDSRIKSPEMRRDSVRIPTHAFGFDVMPIENHQRE
jgi:hypothetical protein